MNSSNLTNATLMIQQQQFSTMFKINACIKMVHQTMLMDFGPIKRIVLLYHLKLYHTLRIFTFLSRRQEMKGVFISQIVPSMPFAISVSNKLSYWIISFKALNNALMSQRILNLHKGNISTPNCVVEVKSIETVYF